MDNVGNYLKLDLYAIYRLLVRERSISVRYSDLNKRSDYARFEIST